jgi:hypothetical protein
MPTNRFDRQPRNGRVDRPGREEAHTQQKWGNAVGSSTQITPLRPPPMMNESNLSAGSTASVSTVRSSVNGDNGFDTSHLSQRVDSSPATSSDEDLRQQDGRGNGGILDTGGDHSEESDNDLESSFCNLSLDDPFWEGNTRDPVSSNEPGDANSPGTNTRKKKKVASQKGNVKIGNESLLCDPMDWEPINSDSSSRSDLLSAPKTFVVPNALQEQLPTLISPVKGGRELGGSGEMPLQEDSQLANYTASPANTGNSQVLMLRTITDQMNTPDSNVDSSTNAPKTRGVKDKACPFCRQPFTSSSFVRHLDLYSKGENPKLADNIHNVEEIRKIRGGITRRRPRNSATKREASTQASISKVNEDGGRRDSLPSEAIAKGGAVHALGSQYTQGGVSEPVSAELLSIANENPWRVEQDISIEVEHGSSQSITHEDSGLSRHEDPKLPRHGDSQYIEDEGTAEATSIEGDNSPAPTCELPIAEDTQHVDPIRPIPIATKKGTKQSITRSNILSADPLLNFVVPDCPDPVEAKRNLWDAIQRPVKVKAGAKGKKKREGSQGRQMGYVYILSSPECPGFYKVGSTTRNPKRRENEWSDKCKLKLKVFIDTNDRLIPHCNIVEKLTHTELGAVRRKFICAKCGRRHMHNIPPTAGNERERWTAHNEWFETSEERVREVANRWRDWVDVNDPYDDAGYLRLPWALKFRILSKTYKHLEPDEWVKPLTVVDWIMTVGTYMGETYFSFREKWMELLNVFPFIVVCFILVVVLVSFCYAFGVGAGITVFLIGSIVLFCIEAPKSRGVTW